MKSNVGITLLLVQTIVLFGVATALPLNALRLYLESAPGDLNTNQLDRSALPIVEEPELVLIEKEPVLVYVPDTVDSDLFARPHLSKSSRLRRTLADGSNPASSPINYQQVWPVLNAAKDRAVELAEEGHRRKQQSVTKREQLENPDVNERLARFSRNLPEQEKMFQIQTVGDLPMFRFG
ncbi:hypothetical protein M3Y97_00279300 [Aphelenchoides bicaudatus]|nr:hypothetical protein M3Y97_00279300 [Aphelenchoides bicaudatus]